MEWDKKSTLPINEIFGLSFDSLKKYSNNDNTSYWHVGRFAIDNKVYARLNIQLFKMLMEYAIHPICNKKNSIMIAECDSRLLAVMQKLGIKARAIGAPVNYLGSETIPIFATGEDLRTYYEQNKGLLLL